MLILAVDTAGEIGSIALADENGTLEEIRLQNAAGFGQVLFGELESLLARRGVRLKDVDLYAGAAGPGSFTGVRVGLAAVKGLAELAGKPAIGISNLAALAEFGSAALRAPIIDARRGEVFAALYEASGLEIIPASVLPFAAFVDLIGERSVEFVTAGFDVARAVTVAPYEMAGMIARLAMQRFLAGEICEPASIEANYVRRADAEIFRKPA